MLPEYLLAVAVWVHVSCTGVPDWRERVEAAVQSASDRYQDGWDEQDFACPVALRASSVSVWDERLPDWLPPKRLRSPGNHPGIVFECGDLGPSWAATGYQQAIIHPGADWSRGPGYAGWVTAHEYGHVVGMPHEGASVPNRCTLMYYNSCSSCAPPDPPCVGSSRKLREDQCQQLIAAAVPMPPPPAAPRLLR